MLSKIKRTIRTRVVISAALCMGAATAYADVVVVVAANSGIDSLTPEQVSDIYLAKKATLPGGVQAFPVDQYEGSALRNEFYTKVMGRNANQLRAYWSDVLLSGMARQRPQQLNDNALVKKKISGGTPGVIGYISKDAVDSSVKVVLTP